MHSRYRSIVALIDPEGGNEGCPRKGEERQVCGQEMDLRLLQRLAAQRAPEEEDASKEFRRCNVLAVLAKRRAGKKAQPQRVNDDSQGKRGGRAAPGGRETLSPTNPAKPRPTLSFSSPNPCMLRFLRLRDAGQYQYLGILYAPVNTQPSCYLLVGNYRQAKTPSWREEAPSHKGLEKRVTGFVTSRFHPWGKPAPKYKKQKTMRHFGGWLPRRANLDLTNPSKERLSDKEGGYSMRRNEPPRGQDSAGARAGIIAARAATVVCGKVALPTVGAGNARVPRRSYLFRLIRSVAAPGIHTTHHHPTYSIHSTPNQTNMLGLNLVVPDPESDGLGPVTLSQSEAVVTSTVGASRVMPMMRARTTNLPACYRHHWELRTNCKRSLDDSIPRLAMGQAGGFHVFNLPRSPLKPSSCLPPGNSTVIIPGMVTQAFPTRKAQHVQRVAVMESVRGKKEAGKPIGIGLIVSGRMETRKREKKQYGDDDQIHARWQSNWDKRVAISKAETIERANSTPSTTNGLTIKKPAHPRSLRMGGAARLLNASRSLQVLGQASCDSGITPTQCHGCSGRCSFPQSQQPICASREFLSEGSSSMTANTDSPHLDREQDTRYMLLMYTYVPNTSGICATRPRSQDRNRLSANKLRPSTERKNRIRNINYIQ
ncbi:hypothetical protein An01g04020 [Aspergillus niger]|uniref:Uncharacterized protein n=2 Tax=Aspergillus niger TaxID=5061 RepID=A2Q8E1_ASPNC|nr:hypothetical protein An01g04020 [Aspergillus niger]CAK36938.1 hypothetical protein An01g04020 [Aspergillus niger]